MEENGLGKPEEMSEELPPFILKITGESDALAAAFEVLPDHKGMEPTMFGSGQMPDPTQPHITHQTNEMILASAPDTALITDIAHRLRNAGFTFNYQETLAALRGGAGLQAGVTP